MDTNDKLLTTAELARRLDVSQDKLRALAKDGEIPSVLVGVGRRFFWPDVLMALRAGGHTGRKDGGK
ncbi:MAG: helix-turn-helix domain-containing protein [Planctomycetes bacterium]|nr:helix-turn-helix domain-containing protein [Planctomycetota bacterium]